MSLTIPICCFVLSQISLTEFSLIRIVMPDIFISHSTDPAIISVF